MIEQIVELSDAGLFAASTHTPPLQRVSLVFAENSRGKSTLSAVIRACAEQDHGALATRATLGVRNDPRVKLLVRDAAGQPQTIEGTGIGPVLCVSGGNGNGSR